MASVLWSNPTATEGQTPAQLQSRYEVSGGNISGVLGELLKQRQIQQQQMQQAAQASIKGVADYVQGQKNDKIAQTFLDQASQYDSENPDATAMIARQLNESDAGPSDAWKAFQNYQQNKIKTDLEQAHSNYFNRFTGKDGQPASPTVDETTGMVWNGRQWVRSGRSQKDEWDKAVPVARGKLDTGGNFTNQYSEAGQGDQIKLQMPNGKSVVVPYSSWQARKGDSTPPAQPVPEPSGSGKQLDSATAAQILAEAGGDKDKAREIAKQRGYSF